MAIINFISLGDLHGDLILGTSLFFLNKGSEDSGDFTCL